ncbi:hypothetical protein DO97_06385 [Neosynechococcus sphagnicola sy1]|uniref:Cxxc_20_cxxc protein n=1 Tax=Neosynechococcus sphagnicola sy1 TaxID=1497020 RepID=A0A098TNW8_9CYAN|nr:hypothetical protein [Neosynechococcus sphagnicola]KGF73956.1 hypothetical protein DO97_06385 [Neosynechococcus sphagnicola sy1]
MKKLTCPSCKKNISFWNFAKAPTPFHLKCDHCHTELKLENHAGVILGIAIAFALITGLLISTFNIFNFFVILLSVAASFEVILFILISAFEIKLIAKK